MQITSSEHITVKRSEKGMTKKVKKKKKNI